MAKKVEAPGAASALPVLTTVCLGQTASGVGCVVQVRTQGLAVLERELLSAGGSEAELEGDFASALYQRIYLRHVPSAQDRLEAAKAVAPLKGSDVEEAFGYGIAKKFGAWHVYELSISGDKVTHCDMPTDEVQKPSSPGGYSDFALAYGRLDELAERNLLHQDTRPR